MSHIDTLKAYDDAISSGYTPESARFHVKSLDEAFDGIDAVKRQELDFLISRVVSSNDLAFLNVNHSIQLLKKDFGSLRSLVGWFGTAILIPIALGVLGLVVQVLLKLKGLI